METEFASGLACRTLIPEFLVCSGFQEVGIEYAGSEFQ